MRRHAAGWALMIVAGAAASCRQEVTVPLGSPFEIAAGQSVLVAGTDLRLHFDHVVADSRCPRGVTCIAAGEAVVAVDAGNTGRREMLELHLPGGETLQPSAPETYAGYRIRIRALEPAPLAGVRPDSTAYTATLVVDR